MSLYGPVKRHLNFVLLQKTHRKPKKYPNLTPQAQRPRFKKTTLKKKCDTAPEGLKRFDLMEEKTNLGLEIAD